MKSLPAPGRLLLFSLLGAAAGLLVLHPYTTLVYDLYGRPGDILRAGPGTVFREIASSFRPGPLSRGLPFAFLGAVAGLFFGFWLEARRRRLEMEKRMLAMETIRQLMMTVSHHLLNAVQVVGGFAARDARNERDEAIRKHLDAIRNEAVRIEAVVKALQSLESVRIDRFLENGRASMVDIERELSERMKEAGRGRN